MSRQHKAVARYAKAACELYKETSVLKQLALELEGFGKIMDANKDLRLATSGVLFSTEKVEPVVSDIAEKLNYSQAAQKLLRVLTHAKRLPLCEAIGEKINLLLLESANVAHLKVLSSETLGDSERSAVESRFKKLLGKEVSAQYSVTPGLLGSIKVVADGRTYDGSLTTQLENLKERMLGGI